MFLQGKVALITGAAGGIGRATAVLFAREGARVAIADIKESEGRAVAQEVQKSGGEAVFVRTDVTREPDCANAVAQTVRAFGRLDVLFNNAGQPSRGGEVSTDQCSEQEWDRIVNVNLKGVFLMTKHAIPELKKTGGTVINTASTAGLHGAANAAAYCSSKGGVIMFTKALAMELAPYNIRVNAIAPGPTDTELMWASVAGERPSPERLHAARASVLDRVPLGRIASPEELAKGVLFLASDLSSYATGSVVVMDGGLTAGRKAAPRLAAR